MHLVTDRQTGHRQADRQTDDVAMPIADHTAMVQQYDRLKPLKKNTADIEQRL